MARLHQLTLLVFNPAGAAARRRPRARSALWGASGNLGWATHVAALIGRGFGYLFIVGGVASSSGKRLQRDLIAFIGWFLLQAAARMTAPARTPGPVGCAGPETWSSAIR
jgi:hypothetical protein